VIGQQLLSLMYGDPASQIANTLNPGGPNPSPGAAAPASAPGAAPGGTQTPGASGGPSGAPAAGPPQPQPPMAPANATQSPPDLAALYVQLHAQDRAAHQIDQGTALMASAFGTAQQQHDMMQYAQSIPQDDTAGAMSKGILAQGEMLKQQQTETQMQEHARFMAGAAGLASLLGTTPETASLLANNPEAFNEMMRTHLAQQAPTEAMKNADAATQAWAQMHPNATPQEIAAEKTKMLTGIIPGPAGEAMKIQAKDKQEFQDNALQDYTGVQSKLNETENILNQLIKDPDHTVAALKDVVPTTGQYANLNPFLSQATADKAVLLNKLKSSLSADQLQNVKNVRNLREFNILGQAATGGLDPASSREQILQTLQTMKNRILDARATSELVVGHKLTGDLVGHGNRDLLDPNNPYYNGATEEAPAPGAAPAASSGGKTYTYNPKTGLLE